MLKKYRNKILWPHQRILLSRKDLGWGLLKQIPMFPDFLISHKYRNMDIKISQP